jgi:hypothetical protein
MSMIGMRPFGVLSAMLAQHLELTEATVSPEIEWPGCRRMAPLSLERAVVVGVSIGTIVMYPRS